MKNYIIIAALGTLFLSGCSLMPYHDNFMCQGGSNVKICKRVSDVLEESDELNLKENTTLHKQNSAYNKSFDCDEKQTNYYQSNCLEYKNCKNKLERYLKAKEKLTQENKQLKDMIEAVSLEELQKPIKIEIECKSADNLKKDYKPLNKIVKVCVFNANIREKPSCKAKVLKVVKKGTKLYGLALINNTWVRLKEGYIHKSLVCGECKEER